MEIELLLLLFLVAASAFFSGMELAYFSLSAGRVRAMVRRGARFARMVENLKKDPQKLLIIVLIGNNIVNVSAAAIATKLALDLFGSVGVGIATGVVTLTLLVFGEIVPKSVAQVHAERISRLGAPILRFLQITLFPLVFVFEQLTRAVRVLLPRAERDSQVSEEEIRSMMHVGVEEGSVEHHEHQFVERLFRFNDEPISRVMIPLADVVMLDGDTLVKQAAHFSSNYGYSRFPVYEGSKDKIVGIVHIKDIVRAGNSERRDAPLKTIASRQSRLNAGMHLDDAFRAMQGERQHGYLVESSEGKIVGFVTMEDLIEELLGEIHDESDSRRKQA